jgi:site-specific DNA recombinase
MVTAMLKLAWNAQVSNSKAALANLKRDIKTKETQIDGLLERVVDASSQTVMAAFERKIETLEKEKLILAEKMKMSGKKRRPFEEIIELTLNFLSNPCNLWKNGNATHRRTLLRLVFSEPLQWERKQGYRTPQKARFYRLCERFSEPVSVMVPRGRIELPTSSLPMTRSTTELPRPLWLPGISLCRYR